MAASRYRKFLRLVEQWPVDHTKIERGRDLGTFIRERVAVSFKKGEYTQINEKECDRIYEHLQNINSDFYRNKYPRIRHLNSAATGSSVEDCNQITSTSAIIEQFESDEKGMLQTLKNYLKGEDKQSSNDKS